MRLEDSWAQDSLIEREDVRSCMAYRLTLLSASCLVPVSGLAETLLHEIQEDRYLGGHDFFGWIHAPNRPLGPHCACCFPGGEKEHEAVGADVLADEPAREQGDTEACQSRDAHGLEIVRTQTSFELHEYW